jgi:hypothetical protein
VGPYSFGFGADLDKKTLGIGIAIAAGIAALVGLMTLGAIDVMRWANCNAPFASPQEKASDVCRNLQKAP